MTPDSRIPFALRGTRVFLVLSMVAWAIGTIQATHHLLNALGTGEPHTQIAIDVRVLAERTVLLIAAAFAYMAILRRRIAGRWLALGLAIFACYRLSYSAWDAWRAAILGDFNMTPPGVAYSTREEGAVALIMNVAIYGWLGFMMVQLAFGAAVRKYFDKGQADGLVGDTSGSGTS